MSYETIDDLTSNQGSPNEHDLEREQLFSLEEHTDHSYSDVVASDCRSLGGSSQYETALENIFNGHSLNDFPVLNVSTESKDTTYKELTQIAGDLVPLLPLGIPKQTFATGVVRRSLLLVYDFFAELQPKETFEKIKHIANRTGMLVAADELEQLSLEDYIYSFDFDALPALAKHDITLYLYVPCDFEERTQLAKHYFKIYKAAKQAGVACRYLLPRLVRQPSGDTKLPIVPNSLWVLGQLEMDADRAFGTIFGGALVESGVPLSQTEASNGAAWELFACNSQDLFAERHAVRIGKTLELPIDRSANTPNELDSQGRFSSLTIPELPLSVIKAPHGCGKSFTTQEFCERVTRKGDAVIHILPRTSLVKQAQVSYDAIPRLEMLDRGTFDNASNLCDTIFPSNTNGKGGQIAFCIESLEESRALGFNLITLGKALSRKGNEGKRVHLVLDELPSILHSILISNTIERPARTMEALASLLWFVRNSGGSVVALSADLTQTEVDLLAGLMGLRQDDGGYSADEIFCVNPKVRQPQPYKRTITLAASKEATINRIYEAIEDKQDGAVLVMLNSLKVSTEVSTINLDAAVQERYPNAKTLVLDSNTIRRSNSEASKFMGASPHEQMLMLSQYDCVFATSVIEAGLNWDSKQFNDVSDTFVRQIFVLDLNGLWGATNLLQASMRVRNQQVPCEIYTPKRRVTKPNSEWLGFYPTPESTLKHFDEVIENFYAITKAVDDRREQIKAPVWSRAYANWVATEQARLMNPRKTLEVLAHANGHRVVISNDVLPQSTINAIRTCLRDVRDRNVEFKAALLAGSISVEGGARISAGEATLMEERLKANRWTPTALRERMAQLLELNESVGLTALESTTSTKEKQKLRTKLDNLGFLSADDALEFEALNCLSVYGREVLTTDDVGWKSEAIKQKVRSLLSERVSSREWFVPAVDEAEMERIQRKRKLDEREMLMLEKQKAMTLGYLNGELRAEGSDMTAEEWAAFSLSDIPRFLDKRFLLSVSEELLVKFNKMIVAQLPNEITEGRVAAGAGLMKAAKCLATDGIADEIKSFERRWLITQGETHIQSVALALGVDEADKSLDILRVRKGLTKRDADEFLTAAFKQGYGKYPQMRLMTSDDDAIEALAEAIYAKRKELSLLIPSVVKPIRKNDGRSNAFAYLSQVFSEVGLGNLRKVGAIKQGGRKISVICLVRKPELLKPAEGFAYVMRRWRDLLEQVAEREKFLAVTDF